MKIAASKMKHNYILTELDHLIKFLQKCKAAYPDRVFVTGVRTGGSISAPTKKCRSYSHKLEHVFAPECFVGNGVQALIDGGGFYIAHIPREHINPELLKVEQKSTVDPNFCPHGASWDDCPDCRH